MRCEDWSCLHVFPSAVLCRIEHCVADLGGLEGVAEGGVARGTFVEALQKVGHLMDKGVLVADAQAGHPPLVHVRHVAVCDVYAAPAARGRLVAVIEELQTVEVMQIPADGGVGTIDLQRYRAL